MRTHVDQLGAQDEDHEAAEVRAVALLHGTTGDVFLGSLFKLLLRLLLILLGGATATAAHGREGAGKAGAETARDGDPMES